MVGWDDFLTARDRSVFAASGYGARMGLGDRPVVVVVDVTYGFCGDRPEPILESIRRWHNSCGEAAWPAIEAIEQVLEVARRKRLPVFYSTAPAPRADLFDRGRWLSKNPRQRAPEPRANDIVSRIGPRPRDVVIFKSKPSLFFGTLFAAFLTDLRADSMIVVGTTTSGCVRATVVDAFSHNYRVAVVAEATFDRGQASHWVNLFDMDQKYADVMSLADAVGTLDAIEPGLFDDVLPGPREPGSMSSDPGQG